MQRHAIALSILMVMGCITEQHNSTTFPELTGKYLGQTPPKQTSELFAPNIISTGMSEINAVFSPDYREFYYTIITPDEQYVITIWPQPENTEEPYHLIATRRSTRKISLGLWSVGFEFEELLNSAHPKWLAPLNDLATGALVPETDAVASY